MRILMITSAYAPAIGGIEILLARDVIPELQRRGHEVGVLTTFDLVEDVPDREVIAGVPVMRTDATHASATPRRLLATRRSVREFITEIAPDVVHSHDATQLIWLYDRSTPWPSTPRVATVHNIFTVIAPELIEIATYHLRMASRITAVSRAVFDDVLKYAPDLEPRLSVVRNAVTPLPPGPALAEGTPFLLCLGSLVERKGFDRAIAAFALIAHRFADARLVIAGDGPMREALAEQAARSGIASQVEFVGPVDRARAGELLGQARALVVPSRVEGHPLVALEAGWRGRRIVAATSPGGLDELVTDGVNGFIVDGDDAPAMAAALEALLGSVGLAQRLGDHARATAEQSQSLRACAVAYEALYDQVRASTSG